MSGGTRWRLAVLGIAAVLVPLSLVSAGLLPGTWTDVSAQESTTFAVEQDGHCVEVAPFEGDENASAFYDYRGHGGHYSSHGTTAFQESQQSQLFLYRGPNGTSLVFLHDELGDEYNGGAVTMNISGLPASGEWVVEDDSYSDDTDDNFNHSNTTSKIDWMWSENRSDGAMFRGVANGSYDAITVDPAFGEESWAYQERDPTWDEATHNITAWNVREPDGSEGGSVAMELDKNKSVAIRRGSCSTPSPTPTVTPTPTPSPTTTASPTPTGTPTATTTETPTATQTPTSSPTSSPTSTTTPTPTPSPTDSPTSTATATQSPTLTPTASPTLTPTASPTLTPTASPTLTPTASPTLTPTASPTQTPTPSQTPTATPSPTPTSHQSGGSSGGGSSGGGSGGASAPESTDTPRPTSTPEPTATPTTTATPTPTRSQTPSPVATPTATLTRSPTPTPTDKPSATATATGNDSRADGATSRGTASPIPEATTADGFRLGAYLALLIVALHTLSVAKRRE